MFPSINSPFNSSGVNHVSGGTGLEVFVRMGVAGYFKSIYSQSGIVRLTIDAYARVDDGIVEQRGRVCALS